MVIGLRCEMGLLVKRKMGLRRSICVKVMCWSFLFEMVFVECLRMLVLIVSLLRRVLRFLKLSW